ncbi:GntR family transcriptional regulator [Halalkalibacter sp. APA_J-10(15)]|uniref:GntR family transcriptional regulator n=1 Tax=unclassified Halalkalibacter TaxID=2893063 RepID=UPI001FF55FEE|nr:GntR family transcriptional regulator [Halalkalibacter sp. APA_J-10(15)]MCK0473138.1 GntR family transcriptional regulator [Halalkalibacter sp. APA_J-10(15)]
MIIDQGIRQSFSSTRDYVYHVLRDNIITLKLEPGTNISEKDISERLNVSRTPVREAFLKLVQDQLLEVYPQRGSFVTFIDLNHVEEARFIREHLERAVLETACDEFDQSALAKLEVNIHMQRKCVEMKDYEQFFQLDEQFHQTIASGCNKNRVWNIIQHVNVHLNRVRLLSLVENYDWDPILEQHEILLKGIKQKNKSIVKEMIIKHLSIVKEEQKRLFKEYPHYFEK